MSDLPNHPETGARKTNWRRIIVIAICVILALLAVDGVLLWTINKPSDLHHTLQTNLDGKVSFPLYYPSPLPKGFVLDEHSTGTVENGVVGFSIKYNGGAILVTEQAKPSIMEEVNKTKKFKTSVGDAYIADLNGHTAGFIVTTKTLIILSTPNKLDAGTLQQIMSSFKPL